MDLAFLSTMNRGMKTNIAILILLRCLFFCFFIYLLDQSIDLGSSYPLLAAAVVLGVSVSSRLAFTKLNSIGFFTAGLIIFTVYKLGIYLVSLINFSKTGMYFISAVIDNHVSIFLLIFAVCAITTWLFWKISLTLTVEIVALIGFSINLLSGHRNFHFENPKLLNNLSWELGFQPLSVILALGIFILLLAIVYTYLASLTNRLHFAKRTATGIFSRGSQNYLLNLLALLTFAAILFFISSELFKHYDKEALSRTANGVGQEKDKGMSPLDFHSALGSTNQPGAIVRLDGDYQENPFLPMLYLRESALSEFNGSEMVVADGFDDDVSQTSPDQVYKIDENPLLKERLPLAQSIYLLTDHKLAFAVDYPTEIRQIKNPNPKRFKGAYKAVSMVPAFKLDEIKNAELGNPNWSPEVWKHYLQPSKDQRYAELAMKITNTYTSDSKPTSEKAFMVNGYLSKNAIYTLTPNHEVNAGEDPVVPFLFGDMRGYCVHFAHATVYMLRALGIPARIGTGYLTDLSQARDGHILLRMSDRHAWAEVYISGKGWVPFDTQPEKVESHAETQIDMKLLEELMGMLEPGEEILPDSTLDNEKNVFEESPNWMPKPEYVYMLAIGLIILAVLVKLYVRYGWMLKTNPASKLKASYIAVYSILYDLGFRRQVGETREEFKKRMVSTLNMQSFTLTDSLNNTNYSSVFNMNIEAIAKQRKQDVSALKNLTLKSKLRSLLSPSSVIAFVTGHKW